MTADTPHLLGPGEGEDIGGRIRIKCALEGLVLTETEGAGSTEPHVHHHHADGFRVLEGELTVLLGREEHVLGPGDFALAPPELVHRYRTDGARWINLHAPGCGFEEWLRRNDPSFDQHDPPAEGGRPASDGVLRRAGEGEAIAPGPGAAGLILAGADDGLGSVSVVEFELDPGAPGPPAHRHERLTDSFYVLEGTLGVLLGEEEHRAGPGSYAFVPPGNRHTVSNPSERARPFPQHHRARRPRALPARAGGGRPGGLCRDRGAQRRSPRIERAQDVAVEQDSATRGSRIECLVHCPFCSSDSTRVVDSRLSEPGDAVRRRRECEQCGERFTTYERAEEPRVMVTKRDGRRERFDSQKLLRGLARAAGGRPVSDAQLEAVAGWIAAELRRDGAEVEAGRVGELAERGLARVDPVSAIQFASVYRNLADLDELEAVVRRFKEDPLPGADQLAIEEEVVPSGTESSIDLSPENRSPRRRVHVRQS